MQLDMPILHMTLMPLALHQLTMDYGNFLFNIFSSEPQVVEGSLSSCRSDFVFS